MKKLIFFLLFCNFVSAQKLSQLELLSAISDDICQEVSKSDVKVENEKILGIYILKAVNKHIEDVEFYFGNDYTGNENIFFKIGEEIGFHLALKCPEIFDNIFSSNTEDFEFDFLTVTGKFDKINKNQFLTFTIKEDSGKSHEFLLLNDFETSYLLTDKLLKANDKIIVSYYISEFYDAKMGKFVNYKIVTSIEKK